MTNKEAIRILMSDADFSGVGEKAKMTADALCVAIEALEKRISKKPICERGSKRISNCPTCNCYISRYWICCPYCETKLDWSEENDE